MFLYKQMYSLRKKFYRRTALLTFLCYASILNAVQDDEILGRNKQFRFLGRGPGQHLSKPFSPHLRVLSSSEVQVSWLPVITQGGPFPGRYELFIDDEMEYVGHDLEYLAKRLKPGVEYAFKIRACGVELGTCSDFSFPRYAKTEDEPRFGGRSGSALTGTYLGKRRIFLIILTAILGPVAIIAFMISVFLFFRYMFYHLRNTPCLDANDPELQFNVYNDGYGNIYDKYSFNSKYPYLTDKYTHPYTRLKPALGDSSVTVRDEKNSKHQETAFEENDHDDKDTIRSDNECCEVEEDDSESKGKEGMSRNGVMEDASSPSGSSDEEKIYDSESGCPGSERKEQEEKLVMETDFKPVSKSRLSRRQNREKRARARTLSDSDKITSQRQNIGEKATSTGKDEETGLSLDGGGIVVVVDNSNIFIGGRETACAVTPGLKQRHVKLRLQALVKVLERKRLVTKAYAGGSSPPGNPLVWDVYKRLGYVVDLEDRRGKDEQRVDEQLHLSIYKALLELPPQTLVLATGDGSKGKGSGDTSFPKCAEAALDQGWKVEVHSWRHCTSAEWHKIASKYRARLRIHYLDDHLHDITYVEYRGRRITGSHSESESGQIKESKSKSGESSQANGGHQKKEGPWKVNS